MSLDLANCKTCGDAFIQGGGNEVYCSCGNHFCCSSCADEGDIEFNEEMDENTCKFCRGEVVEDSDLLNFILTECGISRGEVEEKYRERHKEA